MGSCRGLLAELDGLGGAGNWLSDGVFGRGKSGAMGLRWPISLRIVASRSRCLSSVCRGLSISGAGDATLGSLFTAVGLRCEVNHGMTVAFGGRLTWVMT